MSARSTPISSGTCTAALPGESLTSDFCTPPNKRALWFAPLRSSRVSAVQCTTAIPAARAARASRAQLPTRSTAAAASASAGKTDGEPTTPFWTSCNTSAVCSGATSAARSSGIGEEIRGELEPGDELVEQVGDLPRAREEHVEAATGRIHHVFPRLGRDFVEPERCEAIPERTG